MCVYIKIAPYCRSAIECFRNQSTPFYTKSACSRIIEFVCKDFSFGKNVSSDLAFFSKVFQEVRCIFEDLLCAEGLAHTIELACCIQPVMAWNAGSDFLFSSESAILWTGMVCNAFVLMNPQTSISLEKFALGGPKGGEQRSYHVTKCLLACTLLLLRLGHAVLF